MPCMYLVFGFAFASDKKDVLKVNFTLAALEADDPFAHNVVPSVERGAASQWHAKKTASKIIAAR